MFKTVVILLIGTCAAMPRPDIIGDLTSSDLNAEAPVDLLSNITKGLAIGLQNGSSPYTISVSALTNLPKGAEKTVEKASDGLGSGDPVKGVPDSLIDEVCSD